MSDHHPLNDEICEHLADTTDRPFTAVERSNMRAAHDLGVKSGRGEMLNEVLDWIKKNHVQGYGGFDGGGDYVCSYYSRTKPLFKELEEAMRPTQEKNS